MKQITTGINLKSITAFLLLATAMIFAGCSNPVSSEETDDPTGGTGGTGLWQDAPVRTSSMAIAAGSVTPSSLSASSVSISAGAEVANEIYFRSSDIEFWSVDSLSDVENIMSAKYVDPWDQGVPIDYEAGHSLEYKIGDAHKSVAFSPDEDISVSISNPELNPEWSTDVQDFLSATVDNTINLMRLDIGGGNVTYVIDGEEVSVGGDSYVEGNSIVFVDKALLSEPVMVDQHDAQSAIFDQVATAESLGISEADFQTVSTIHTQSNTNDDTTMIDVNGALYLPFDPVDLSGFDPATETLKIVLRWDIAGAVMEDQDQYMVDSRVAGTPFDFSVELVRE